MTYRTKPSHTAKTEGKVSRAVATFSDKPDEALVSLNTAAELLDRSRVSLYRDIKAGRFTLVKLGNSSRLRVGEVRKAIAG